MKYTKLNEYLSNLAVINVKLHNLHWNVQGLEFMAIHTFTEDLYNAFFLQYDDIAELIKIQGKKPLATLKDYLNHASITESQKDNFTPIEVVKILLEDLNTLRKQAKEIRSIANEEDDFNTVSMFEEHLSLLDKNLWFLRSML